MIPAIMRIRTLTTIRLIKSNKKDINNTNNDRNNNDNEFLVPRGPCTFFHNREGIFVNRSQLFSTLGGWENPNFFL